LVRETGYLANPATGETGSPLVENGRELLVELYEAGIDVTVSRTTG
jgi:hypothetical protein